MNWKLALGSHKVGIKAQLYYNSKTHMYTMRYTITAYDRYNFDKVDGYGERKKFYGIPDEANGRFVVLGMAKFFTSIGTMKGVIKWIE